MRLRPTRYKTVLLKNAEEVQPVPIVGDAAIATVGIGYGRLISLIIVDTATRPDLAEMISVQAHFESGDAIVQWAVLPNRTEHIALFLRFERPVECAALLEFEIVKQGILVEHILQSNALYLQAGKPGDRLVHDLNRPKMLIEVPDTGIRSEWNEIYFNSIVKFVRKDGLRKREAKQIAQSFIQQTRELAKFRMKSGPRAD
jgi:hypothetical protein